ncbi:MAG: membrane lipoprotein lipid attachment site-containing protein [Bacilli bacterium]|nr:membrane lipoprotein lipid attachment site-containing protein [Bacilli bacterium]
MKKVLLTIVSILFLSGCSIEKIDKNILTNKTDAERFATEYKAEKISADNPYVYKTATEIIDILENGTGIIYFGFPECPWCKQAIVELTRAAKELEIEKIYYFNPKEIRDENTKEYKKIVEILNDYLEVDANGNKRLFVPDVYFISGGKIIGHNFKTVSTQTDVTIPMTDVQKDELKDIFKKLMSETYNIDCDC